MKFPSMKYQFILCILLISIQVKAQESSPSDLFWDNLTKHCGKAYEGKLVSPESDPRFDGKLIMHVRSCDGDQIRIPFFVNEDRSRTWVLTQEGDGLLQLKHDHRHEDGSEDQVTQYGGKATTTGSASTQFFPADQFTADLLPAAVGNVWWITLDENTFTYNLRRLGSSTLFTVQFDLTQPIDVPAAPWGWVD